MNANLFKLTVLQLLSQKRIQEEWKKTLDANVQDLTEIINTDSDNSKTIAAFKEMIEVHMQYKLLEITTDTSISDFNELRENASSFGFFIDGSVAISDPVIEKVKEMLLVDGWLLEYEYITKQVDSYHFRILILQQQ